MRIIGGLDTSLTSTGIGLITQISDGTCKPSVTRVTSRGKEGATYTEWADRIRTLSDQIVYALGTCILVVVEGPSHDSKSKYKFQLNWILGVCISKLRALNVPIAIASPTANKRFITGAGTAGKGAVRDAIVRLYPEIPLSTVGTAGDDEADGLSLAHAGAVYLGWNVPILKRHIDGLTKIEWPSSPLISDRHAPRPDCVQEAQS